MFQAYITQHNCDLICLCERFSIQNDDDRIKIDGYSVIRSDHPSDSKKERVDIYYKEHIPLIKRVTFELWIIVSHTNSPTKKNIS